MCKNNNLTILNGRYGHDKQIGAMTFRDTSVIDYALASSDTFEILLDFEVVEVDRLFSDGHSLLALDLQTHSLNLPNPLEKNISQHTYIKPSEYECFVQNFDETKIANIVTELQTCDINTSKDAINNITSQIGELFQISASKVHDCRPANSTGTTKHDRPWFGHQCRNARKKYHLARRKYNLYNSSENKQQLISESRAYKKTMTKFINKHKKQQQNKLRQMQKSQPREYRPVIIAFGVPLIATETFLCLSESFLCHLQHTKSPHKISERKRYYNTLIYSLYNTFCGSPVRPP